MFFQPLLKINLYEIFPRSVPYLAVESFQWDAKQNFFLLSLPAEVRRLILRSLIKIKVPIGTFYCTDSFTSLTLISRERATRLRCNFRWTVSYGFTHSCCHIRGKLPNLLLLRSTFNVRNATSSSSESVCSSFTAREMMSSNFFDFIKSLNWFFFFRFLLERNFLRFDLVSEFFIR